MECCFIAVFTYVSATFRIIHYSKNVHLKFTIYISIFLFEINYVHNIPDFVLVIYSIICREEIF